VTEEELEEAYCSLGTNLALVHQLLCCANCKAAFFGHKNWQRKTGLPISFLGVKCVCNWEKAENWSSNS
jgi:hypothetical protein